MAMVNKGMLEWVAKIHSKVLFGENRIYEEYGKQKYSLRGVDTR